MSVENFSREELESKIYLVRGHKVILDSDLADLYLVSTKRLNEQVRRNLERFPHDFAFTQQGTAMLSSVLRTPRAIQVNIAIMRAFVNLRSVLNSHRDLEQKLNNLEQKYDGRFRVVFEAIKEMMSDHKVPRKRVIGHEPEE